MRISYIDMNNLKRYPLPMCACIGYFDGIHLGHQKLITATREMAERYHCDSALITFDPDPREVTVRYPDVHHIMTLRQKINKAMDLGIDNIYILKFTEEMSKLTPDAFIEMLLKTCDLKGLVCGFDFHYGRLSAVQNYYRKECPGHLAGQDSGVHGQGDRQAVCECDDGGRGGEHFFEPAPDQRRAGGDLPPHDGGDAVGLAAA